MGIPSLPFGNTVILLRRLFILLKKLFILLKSLLRKIWSFATKTKTKTKKPSR